MHHTTSQLPAQMKEAGQVSWSDKLAGHMVTAYGMLLKMHAQQTIY